MPVGSIGSGVFYLVLTTSRRLMLCFFLCRRFGFSIVMRIQEAVIFPAFQLQ
jgi:hypothetical protein